MTKTICALAMVLSMSSVSCNEITRETKPEIMEVISAHCSSELRDVLVQNLYVQVIQQQCYTDSYRVQKKDCQRNNCSYIVTKEEYLKK